MKATIRLYYSQMDDVTKSTEYFNETKNLVKEYVGKDFSNFQQDAVSSHIIMTMQSNLKLGLKKLS